MAKKYVRITDKSDWLGRSWTVSTETLARLRREGKLKNGKATPVKPKKEIR